MLEHQNAHHDLCGIASEEQLINDLPQERKVRAEPSTDGSVDRQKAH